MLKKLMIVSLVLGLFSTGLMAKESNYEDPKIPELTLNIDDLSVIQKAIGKKGLSKLNKKEKLLIQKFLLDYAISAKHEKCKNDDDCFPLPVPSDKKVKGKKSKK